MIETLEKKINIHAEISFEPLIGKLTELVNDDKKGSYIKSIIDSIEDRQLVKTGEEVNILEYKDILDLLHPIVNSQKQYIGILKPFDNVVIYASSEFEELFVTPEKQFRLFLSYGTGFIEDFKELNAYLFIAKEFYGLQLELGVEKVFQVQNKDTGLLNYFLINLDVCYIEIVKKKEISVLSSEELEHIKSNADNLTVWRQYIDLNNFEFKGLLLVRAIELTQHQLISSLRESLIEGDALTSFEKFLKIQEQIRAYLQIKEIILGLAAIDKDRIFLINKGIEEAIHRKHILCSQWSFEDFKDSLYVRLLESSSPITIDDLQKLEKKSKIELEMGEKGIRSIFIAPLYYEEKLIGALQIFSHIPGLFSPLFKVKMEQVLSLFSLATRKILDEMERNTQLVIQEKYTAIHPSVSWKFKSAALNYLHKKALEEESVEPEEIRFDNVYPLFAMSDIRGSSSRRNHAIQEDLVLQLNLARKLLKGAYSLMPFSYIDKMIYKINKKIQHLEEGIQTGDEAVVVDYFKTEVDPGLQKIVKLQPELKEEYNQYISLLDSEHGAIYQKRKEYDKNISLINKSLSDYIETEEVYAQKVCPHYFEKNATDGVDFSIYIGESLVENNYYDPMYLKELRIWQIKVLCGLANVAEKLKSETSEDFEVTHLILVQNMPLSIQYRLEDTQFIVSGSYNIRYEILKKRIDKAKVKNTEERITQPGMISIIYSQHKEYVEYMEYIEYLIERGFLEKEVEELSLEELQGVSGLQAIRIKPIIQKK
ncbi:MAG: GAF domain-containing protein [Leptospiraceae bacterium]|nr:GAF domain-containing protein [Leptospiraceae bacterium]MCP5501034.1 GAF domain-containing protein [Leptospiraceae bacterium]